MTITTPIPIKRWLSVGEFSEGLTDTNQVLDEAGTMMDRSCTNEILGRAVFEGEDGKFYGVFINADVIPFEDEAEANEWCDIEDEDGGLGCWWAEVKPGPDVDLTGHTLKADGTCAKCDKEQDDE